MNVVRENTEEYTKIAIIDKGEMNNDTERKGRYKEIKSAANKKMQLKKRENELRVNAQSAQPMKQCECNAWQKEVVEQNYVKAYQLKDYNSVVSDDSVRQLYIRTIRICKDSTNEYIKKFKVLVNNLNS